MAIDVTAPSPGCSSRTRGRVVVPSWMPVAVALVVAAVLIVVTNRWGEALLADGLRMKIHTPPLRGPLEWRPGRSALPAVLVAVAAITWWPTAIGRLPWRPLLVAAALIAVAWAVTLALVDGPAAITEPLAHRSQYLATVPRVGDLGEFLRTFSDRIAAYNVHTQGHPPGMVTLLWLLDAAWLGGADVNAVLVLGGGAVSVVAALVTVRDVAGEALARRVAVFLPLAPAAIWWSSGDALFAGVGAVAVMLAVRSTGREGPSADRLAVGSGVAFAATAYLSYGLVLLAAIPLAVAAVRRRPRPIVVAAGVAAVVVALVTVTTGFAWWAGLAATRQRYFAGVGGIRPYGYFLVADLAVFALMIGPAGVAGLVRRPPTRALAAVVVGAIAAVLLADVSGMSKAEVERIWIPFVPWVLVGAGSAVRRIGTSRDWLTAQALVTLLLAVGIRSPW